MTVLKYFSNTPYGRKLKGIHCLYIVCDPSPLMFLFVFTATPATSMLLACFSHQAAFHLLANMYVLHNFSAPIVNNLGTPQFVAVFLSGGTY